MVDVDDEVGVLRGDLRAAFAPALEPGRLDEPAGPVAGRVLEDAAEAANPVRLRGLALRLDRIGALTNAIRIIGVHAEPRTHDHIAGQLVLETRMAVAEVAFSGGERERLATRRARREI